MGILEVMAQSGQLAFGGCIGDDWMEPWRQTERLTVGGCIGGDWTEPWWQTQRLTYGPSILERSNGSCSYTATERNSACWGVKGLIALAGEMAPQGALSSPTMCQTIAKLCGDTNERLLQRSCHTQTSCTL